jgi:hypothetical protein
MLYQILSIGAEDGGTGRSWTPDGSIQTGALTFVLLRDGLSVVKAGSSGVAALPSVAEAFKQRFPVSLVLRPARVFGPQPASEPRPDMLQIVSTATVRLADECLVKHPDGSTTVRFPYVLEGGALPEGCGVFVLESNPDVLLFTLEARNFLQAREATLEWRAARFLNEPEEVTEPDPPPERIPTREELLAQLHRGKV